MNKYFFLISMLVLLCHFTFSQRDFITVWEPSNDYGFYSETNGVVKYSWEELNGNLNGHGEFNANNTYYSINIPDSIYVRIRFEPINLKHFYFKHKNNLINIEQWGDVEWESMELAFGNSFKLDSITAVDIPNLSKVKSTSNMFSMCANLKHVNLIENWMTHSIENMSGMFSGTSAFNQDISGWDVSSVTNMSRMFENNSTFNQNIGSWNISSVKHLYKMFYNNPIFNHDLSQWDVSQVRTTYLMFANATSFNSDIGKWDVSKVEEFTNMFENAINFNQNLGLWDVNSADYPEGVYGMLSNCGLDCQNYSSTLKGWSENPNLPYGLDFPAEGMMYGRNAIPFRDKIKSEKGWHFYDLDILVDSNCIDGFLDIHNDKQSLGKIKTINTNEIEISSQKETLNIIICNTIGKKIDEKKSSANETVKIKLPAGIYLIQLSTNTRKEKIKVIL